MKHVGNLQYITFLKGLAILGVILVHAPQLIKEINPLIREFLHAGAFGCQLFFVISGFLAVKSWERLLAKYENSTEKNRTTYKTFLKKRYLSIAPIYILFILFYQIISYYIATFNVEPFYKISHNPLSILANIFLLNGLDYQAFNNIVPGGWFIGTIFLFYLLFPLIYKLYRYIKTYNPRLLFLLPLGGVIVSAIFQTGIFFIIGDWTLSKPGSFTYYSIINQLPCMLIGVTLNYYLKNTKLSKNNLLLCFICLGLIGNLLWYALRLHYWIYALIPSIIGWSFFYLFLYVQRKLYLIAYAIKKECIRIEFKNNLLNFITSITVAFGMYSLSLLALRWNYTDFASLYPKQMSSVPVMISSVYLFLGIKHLTFKSNFINKLSAHTLAVYLISEHTCLFKWFWTDILRTDKLWNAGIFEYLGYSSLIILSVFVSCILIDYIIKNTIYKILPNTPKFLINIEHYFKIKT